uniref:SGNH hydrolase-type esterase domain-containing protein n=1 Tax=Magallana gigas TaxID=29159 RepID=A0A8W8IPF9_MAGGI
MLRVRNQRASKARSPYAAVPNGTNTVASSSVLARGRRGNRRGGQVRQPVANISNINAPPTQATPPTPAAPTTPATQASTEAGQGMSRSGMIGMIPHNMPPIVNPTPDAPSALSSHVPTNMNQDSVWIIGSSIIHWAQKYAETTNQLNLGLNHFTINWNGRRGMVWEYLYTTVSNLLPNTLIVWSHILPRSNWRQSLSTIEGENSRRRINSAIATFVLKKLNGASIKYPDIQITQKRLFRLDGVHLSDLGNNIYINSLKNAIVQFVTSSSRTYP